MSSQKSSTTIDFCFTEDFPSLEDGIFALSPITKSSLKKIGLKKNYLKKSIKKRDVVKLPLNILNFGKINPVFLGQKPQVIFEDESFIIFSKPHRIHTHPLSYNESDNLLSFISVYNSSLLHVNQENFDRGFIYRLDYETSGLLYYAKTSTVYFELRKNFKTLIRRKKYLALVSGKVNESKVIHYLKTSDKKGSRVIQSDVGKRCELEIETLNYNESLDQSLLLINLKEGFKHQIRAQLAILGSPIIGDPLYGGNYSERMWLHCYQYLFVYEGKKYEYCDKEINVDLFFNFNNFNSKP